MPDDRSNNEAIAALTQGIAEFRKCQTERKISNTASFARIMEMMEEMRAEMRSEFRELKRQRIGAEKQPAQYPLSPSTLPSPPFTPCASLDETHTMSSPPLLLTPSEHHEIVSSPTESNLILKDEMKIVSAVDAEDLDDIDSEVDKYSDSVLAKLTGFGIVHKEIFSIDSSSSLVLQRDESKDENVESWVGTSVCVLNDSLNVCPPSVRQNAHERIVYPLSSGKPPPLPPEVTYLVICHSGLARAGNDISISEEMISFSHSEARNRIVEVGYNGFGLDSDSKQAFVFYADMHEVELHTARGVIEYVVWVFLGNIPEGLILPQLKTSTKIIWKGTFEVTYKIVLEAEITMKRLPTLAESMEGMIYITELCGNSSGSLWDQSKPIHVLKLSLDRLKGLVMMAFETAFFILGLSLVDPAFQVCCVNKFGIFSSPRPPEVANLEDKVLSEGGSIVTNQGGHDSYGRYARQKIKAKKDPEYITNCNGMGKKAAVTKDGEPIREE